jgi:hypothetical protein
MFYTFSYDDILDPANNITKCLDEAWKFAMKLKWADPPGDLRFLGDTIPHITVNNIIVGSTEFYKTDAVLRVYVTLNPDERDYLIDAKIFIDPDEFQYLINESMIDPLTHYMHTYDDTRDNLKSMVVFKHFLNQVVLHLKPKFGLMYTSRALRECSCRLTCEQRVSLMSNKQKEEKENAKKED